MSDDRRAEDVLDDAIVTELDKRDTTACHWKLVEALRKKHPMAVLVAVHDLAAWLVAGGVMDPERQMQNAVQNRNAEIKRLEQQLAAERAENKELHDAISGPTRMAGGVSQGASDPEVDSPPDSHAEDQARLVLTEGDLRSMRATDNLTEPWTVEAKLALLDMLAALRASDRLKEIKAYRAEIFAAGDVDTRLDWLISEVERLKAENEKLKQAWDALPRSEAVEQLIALRAKVAEARKMVAWMIDNSIDGSTKAHLVKIADRLRSTGDSDA